MRIKRIKVRNSQKISTLLYRMMESKQRSLVASLNSRRSIPYMRHMLTRMTRNEDCVNRNIGVKMQAIINNVAVKYTFLCSVFKKKVYSNNKISNTRKYKNRNKTRYCNRFLEIYKN